MGSSTLFTVSSSSFNSVPKLNAINTKKLSFSDKLNKLASEFTSLPEPIERVKRLLHYASLLAPLREGERVESNRVAGCGTQVWVVAEMDDRRRMRFRADSDSEISKGFCWCLVWLLDGAKPEEVLLLHKDHLPHITLKAHSRINTWHNVFFTMQIAAKDFIIQPP